MSQDLCTDPFFTAYIVISWSLDLIQHIYIHFYTHMILQSAVVELPTRQARKCKEVAAGTLFMMLLNHQSRIRTRGPSTLSDSQRLAITCVIRLRIRYLELRRRTVLRV